MKSIVIVNPKSGNGRTEKTWKKWKKKIEIAIGPFDELWTERVGDGERLARKALLEGYSHIHAVGGDGTAAEVANGFFQQGQAINPQSTLSLWPAGSGCDFLRSLHNPDSLTQSVPNSLFSVDLGRLSFRNHAGQQQERYVLNIASCGISGYVDQLMAKRGKVLGGRLGFLLSTVEALGRYKNHRVRIKTDRGDLGEIDIRCVAIANGKYFGAGMKIAPNARLDDSKFQLVILGDISLWDALIHTPQLYAGTHLKHPKIISEDVTWVEITGDEKVLLDVDGEPLGTLPLRIEIVPSALRIKAY